jgi:hypothetical protein
VFGLEHVAADLNVLRQLLALRQQFQRRQPPRSVDDLIRAGLRRSHLQILQQAVRGDAGGKLNSLAAEVSG